MDSHESEPTDPKGGGADTPTVLLDPLDPLVKYIEEKGQFACLWNYFDDFLLPTIFTI